MFSRWSSWLDKAKDRGYLWYIGIPLFVLIECVMWSVIGVFVLAMLSGEFGCTCRGAGGGYVPIYWPAVTGDPDKIAIYGVILGCIIFVGIMVTVLGIGLYARRKERREKRSEEKSGKEEQ